MQTFEDLLDLMSHNRREHMSSREMIYNTIFSNSNIRSNKSDHFLSNTNPYSVKTGQLNNSNVTLDEFMGQRNDQPIFNKEELEIQFEAVNWVCKCGNKVIWSVQFFIISHLLNLEQKYPNYLFFYMKMHHEDIY